MKHLILLFVYCFIFTGSVFATVDPRSVPNNKVGVGILSPESDIEDAASMVNSNGDWGWVLITIKRDEMNVDRWQGVFHKLSKNRLIPIVRLATDFDSANYWQRPGENDAALWAEFLSKLYWPTKNRYVQIYNEVNRAGEWGGSVDAFGYARELDKTISALKAKSPDFFVLNAPLDQALLTTNSSLSEEFFLNAMQEEVPAIFSRLDGFASHSYPNPAFSASPHKTGRAGIDGYKWELQQINSFLGGKDLPVFITETGWSRNSLPETKVAEFYGTAFEKVWADQQIVAVTPFVFDYPDGLFHDFSFKTDGETPDRKYYAQFGAVQELLKKKGEPIRDNLAKADSLQLPEYVLKDKEITALVKVKNTGNSVWLSNNLKLVSESQDFEILGVNWDRSEVFPGEDVRATFNIRVLGEGPINIKFRVFDDTAELVSKEGQLISETALGRIARLVQNVFKG